jgi:PAS domain S-box-containing protein
MTQREVSLGDPRQPLELAIQAAGLGEFAWDLARDVFVVSPRMAAITGLPEGETPAGRGEALDRHIHPDDRQAVVAQRAADLARGDCFAAEFRQIRPDDGRTIWVRAAGVIMRDAAGRASAVSGIVQDVTERRLEDQQRQHLMAELDHRVKNVLAAVQALAQQTAKRTTSLDAFLANFGGRLRAMASANELLTAARWRGAAVEHLVAAELGAISPGQTGWGGPELFLTPRAANALSLALHELATNAMKFGALSVESGHVEVRWKDARGGFELTWTETGGPTVAPPGRRGFGSTLLDQVTPRELNGEAQVAVAPRPETVPEAPAARVTETISAASAPTNLRGSKVLIVEDAVLLALELETGLSEAGAHVVGPAYELEEAMALLDRPIDAAVLDANLNGRSVTPVAEALSKRGVPFVFATGYGETGGAPGGFEAPVIRKPYDVTQVAAAVAELLAAS